jgi:CsoR family transcriptional regulator, copper-sensing transcriptional repressor
MQEDKKILTALKKGQSHLGNVIKMMQEKKYCVDIMQQNLAVIGLLKSANNILLERHLNSCFAHVMAGTNKNKKQKMISEVVRLNQLSK